MHEKEKYPRATYVPPRITVASHDFDEVFCKHTKNGRGPQKIQIC